MAGDAYDRGHAAFLPGTDLSRLFYLEAVRPLIAGQPHGAARIGPGSEVLGFDTPRSTDHGWGPQLQVFVEQPLADTVRASIDTGLPEHFRGWPVRFGWDDVLVQHHVAVVPLDEWLISRLGFNPETGISTVDWLITPQQLLLEVTGGGVFQDQDGRLERIRADLAWYPDEIWRWLLACQWRRLAQEEPFAGRTSEVGDEFGSRIVTARLVRDLMRLCFLMDRRYAPYSKWLGSAFKQLDIASEIGPHLETALAAGTYSAREAALCSAYASAARRFNDLELMPDVDTHVRQFHSRPYRVLGCDRFVNACLEGIQDKGLKLHPLVGNIDQVVDSVDILSYPKRIRQLDDVYAGLLDDELE